ncbi:CHAT domain-containing protein [Aerosakkonemataceae cyanobacterium BLCC-F154]|uniref:CHAT domain-containing protein n=1 Tax=Floridaenema fluviatile BLCC-F154 TaxID=3153640 RepID=A0ABV4YJS0_9CYAN
MQGYKIGISLFSSLLVAMLVTAVDLSAAFLSIPVTLARSQNDRSQADQLLQRGIQEYRSSQFFEAIKSWEAALKIYQSLSNKQQEKMLLGNLGAAYLIVGNNQKAIEVSQALLKIAQETDDRQSTAQAFANLGIAYRVLGNYNQAIDSQQKALAIMQEIGDRQNQGNILINLANAYEALGYYDKALTLQNQALTIARELKNPQAESAALGNLGAIYATQGNYQKAMQFYQESLTLAKSINDRQGEGFALQNLGAAYHALGKRDEAISYYQQSLAIAKSLSNPQMQIDSLGNLGIVYEQQGDFAQAIKYHQQVLAIADSLKAPRQKAMALNNLAHTLLKSGQLKEAEKQLRIAIQILDSLRYNLADSEQVSLFDTQVLTYNLLQQVLVAQNQPEAALEMSEHGRSRAFIALLAKQLSSQSKTASTIKPPTLAEIKKIAQQQNATLVEYSIIPEDFLSQGKLRGLGAEIYIWVVKPTGEISFRRSDITNLKTPLKDLVTTSRESIGVRGLGFAVAKPVQNTTSTEKLKQLHQILIQPIADLLPKDPNARVIFVPQDALFLVPFPALVDEADKFLIEKHTILTTPAIQVLELTQQKRRNIRNQQALVVGNPVMPVVPPAPGEPPQQLESLPGAEQEAKAIAQILNTKALIGKEATKQAVVSQMPKARIIHLATHGLLDDFGDGIPGAIALTPAKNDNGLLTAGKILDLELNAELVILSACDTGRGTITGDGVIGLSRSLISAGVSSVIVSLWSVPDAPTSTLMTEFYHNFQQNSDKAQALRNAMLSTMKKHPNPKDWAAFTLIGEAE